MRILSVLIALVLLAPHADAAVMSTTKQKKLPVIGNAYVSDDLQSFGFDIVKAPTPDAYDVWGRLTSSRQKVLAEWFVRSMKFRRRSEKIADARFKGDLTDVLLYAGDGAYEFTLFACPANLKKPTARACASTKATINFAGEE